MVRTMITLPCCTCGIAVTVTSKYVRKVRCEPCKAAYQRSWQRANAVEIAARARAKRRADPRAARAYDATWRAKNPIKMRASKLKYNHGITLEWYNSTLAAQGGGCAICGIPVCPQWGRLSVDHCHTTGRVRGLLCNACNVSIGRFRDQPERLRKAADYLEHHAKSPR